MPIEIKIEINIIKDDGMFVTEIVNLYDKTNSKEEIINDLQGAVFEAQKRL